MASCAADTLGLLRIRLHNCRLHVQDALERPVYTMKADCTCVWLGAITEHDVGALTDPAGAKQQPILDHAMQVWKKGHTFSGMWPIHQPYASTS